MTTRLQATSTDESVFELDRHAFNATFHELGLLWYWDIDTCENLCGRAADARAEKTLRHGIRQLAFLHASLFADDRRKIADLRLLHAVAPREQNRPRHVGPRFPIRELPA